MGSKNIKQNHFLQVKKILDKVDKSGDNANHFRAIVLMGDKNESQAYSYLHAPQKDMEQLLLHAIRSSDVFAYSVCMALEAYYNESKNNNKEQDEENHI